MNDDILDELKLENLIKQLFPTDVEVESIILRRVPVGRTAQATLFLTQKKQLLLFVDSQSPLVLGDVRKIVNRMGLRADNFLPPRGRPSYFSDVALGKFREVFPGRREVSDEDLMFYKTLVPYRPALVVIKEVVGSEVMVYDPDSTTNWRVGAKFSYRRIATS